MRALVYTSPRGLELRDVAQPVAGEGQTVVDVAACGICGSDMHAYLGHDERRPPPLVLGHEAAGVALEGPLAGRRVTVNPLESCGNCDFCVEGRDNLCPDRRIISIPNPPRPVTREVRHVEFEIRGPEGVAGPVRFRAYALYNVCEGPEAACLYRRQDVQVPVGIEGAVIAP